MKNIDEKHHNERLKNTTQSNLGQNTNTPTTELPLDPFEVINFRMLLICEKVLRMMKLHYIKMRYQSELHQGNSSKCGIILSKH